MVVVWLGVLYVDVKDLVFVLCVGVLFVFLNVLEECIVGFGFGIDFI